MEDFQRELEALARELTSLASTADEPDISRRLTEMADEVLTLADREAADSQIYHSAIFFLHTGRSTNDVDPYPDDHSARPAQRN